MATHKVIVSTWPVFAGIIFLILGNGLQGTLLGIREIIEIDDIKIPNQK